MRGNPFGEELMVLNPAGFGVNPRRRRRTRVRVRVPRRTNPRGYIRKRRRGRTRWIASAPWNVHRRSVPMRRRRRGRRRYSTNPIHRRRRVRRNPVERAGFRLAQLPGYVMAGGIGAAAGVGGYVVSKMFLPAKYDRHVLGYAAHGAAGTGIALLGGALLGKRMVPALITGAWVTVLFRVGMNLLKGVKRPAPVLKGLGMDEEEAVHVEGLEEHLSIGEDFDMEDYAEEWADGVGQRRFIGETGQVYQTPEPYDVGQAYQTPEPYDVGQVYQAARSLPAASMPVEAVHQEAPEMGLYSRQPNTQFTPLW